MASSVGQTGEVWRCSVNVLLCTVHCVQSCRFISNGAAVGQQLDCMRFEGIRTMTLNIICFWNVTQYIYDFV